MASQLSQQQTEIAPLHGLLLLGLHVCFDGGQQKCFIRGYKWTNPEEITEIL